jgi:hypothetical protein
MISRRTRGQAAEVTEVDRIAHRPAGHADKRRAFTLNVVRQLGSVKGTESRHNRHPGTASTAQLINWQWPADRVRLAFAWWHPDSDLYAESSDADTVMGCITAHA